VRESRRDQGRGSALLEGVLTRADDAHAPAYVESANERNLAFYQRHGFEVVEEFTLLGKGPRVWGMWHNAGCRRRAFVMRSAYGPGRA